ncbi:MAG: SpaA isopeptide-forming pilin-related protein [Acutalibacteraceae bacterium]|nr:SpaA isopeptide-forming pilin-related protein [Acutalibacteraceae bacterium]
MKHKILSKVLAVGLSALTMLSTVTTALGANIDTVKSGLSSDFTFVYNGAATYSGATLGNFTVKGVSDDKDTNATRQAFCIENSKSDPSRSTLNKFEQSNDEKLAKALYYGWVADESNSVVESVYGSSASNKTARMVVTSATLSQLYSGQSYGNSGSAASQKSKLVSIANDSSKTIPNNKISVTDSNLSVSIKNNKQVTQTTQLKGYSGNSITIKVPANVTLVNETQNKKVTNGTATIKVNDKFHLEAALDYSGTFDSGSLTGSLYDFKVYIAKSKSSSTQDIATYCWVENKTSTVQIKATFKSQLGSLEIIKDSSNHSLTDNNTDCYSLKGAVFTVTNTSTNKQYTVTTNTKVDDGSATVKYKGVLNNIPVGEYTIKETQAPKGYALSTETKTVSVTGASTATSITIKNAPQNDPVDILITKTDTEGNGLVNAEFTIKFYKGYFTEDEIKSGEADSQFKRYWTVKTDNYGYAALDPEYLVNSNNDFYYEGGIVTLPLGTITIQETKAPDGYVIDDTLYVRQITTTGTAESVNTYNAPVIPNDHEEGELKIVKTSEGDIAGIKFNLYKGNSVNADNLIGTYTTDSNGLITKTVDTGTYTVEEIVDSQYQPQEPQTITVTKNNTSSNPATVKFHNQFKTGKLKIVKTSEAIQNADGTTTPGKIEGITFEIYTSSNDLIGTYTTDANGLILEDTLGEFKPGTYRIHEVPVDGYRQLQDKTIEIVANKTTTVKFNNSPQGGTLKILKNVDYSVYSKTAEPFIFKVEGLSNDFYDEVLIYPNKRSKSDDGTLVVRPAVIDLPESGAYKVTEVLTDEQKLYWEEPEQESQIVAVNNNEVKEVTFNNHEKLGSLLIQKTADDGFVEGVTFELTGYSYAGVSVHHIVSTDENGKFEFSELPVGEYILREISSPSPYIYETLGDITVKVEDGKLTTANVHNDNIGRKMQIVKTSDDGKVANIEFKVTCAERNFSKIYKTDEYGIITTEELDAGTYTVEEINTPNKYELQSAKTINIEYPKTESEAEQVYSVKFHNVLKDGTAKIVKTSASGKVEGFEFNITGTAYNGEEISLTGLKTNSNGLITEKIPQGTYTIEEINVPEFYVTPDPQIVEIRAGETSTVEFYNDYSRGDGTVIKTSDDGKVEGLKFRLYGTADCGENVDVISTTNSEGIAKFERILIGTYTLEEVDTPEQYEAFEPIQVAISEDFTAEVTAHNSYREVPVKIVKTSETGVISNIKFQVVNNETGFDETYITDENGLISLNLLPGTYQVTELEVAGYYIPQETKTLTVAPYNSETDVATVSFENILKKGTVRVQKTADDGIIEGVEFRIFGQSEAGTEVNLTATTNSDGIAVFDNIPIGNEYWLMELNQPDRYIAVIEQNFDITWNETTTMLVENNLKKGKISTTAKDKDTDSNYAYANTTTTIVDTVSYEDLGTNTEYTVKGILMDKSTGEPFEVNGEQVTASKTFTTSETGTGTVDVEFIFDSSALIGKSVVVFEQLYYNSVELASHKDIDDEGQTVTFKDPKIGTTAKDVLTDGHDTYVNTETTIVDTVEYNNLIVGKEYKLI